MAGGITGGHLVEGCQVHPSHMGHLVEGAGERGRGLSILSIRYRVVRYFGLDSTLHGKSGTMQYNVINLDAHIVKKFAAALGFNI